MKRQSERPGERHRQLPAIREDEWRAAREAAVNNSTPRGYTVAELADRLHLSASCIRGRMQKYIAAGKWRFIGKRASESVDGRRSFTPEYLPVHGKSA